MITNQICCSASLCCYADFRLELQLCLTSMKVSSALVLECVMFVTVSNLNLFIYS